MMLAGLRVPNEDVFALSKLVDEPTATVLRNAIDRETVVLALTIHDRERIVRALDDPKTDSLAERVLCCSKSTKWRVREGLVWRDLPGSAQKMPA
jgi:hypothetical protein